MTLLKFGVTLNEKKDKNKMTAKRSLETRTRDRVHMHPTRGNREVILYSMIKQCNSSYHHQLERIIAQLIDRIIDRIMRL